MEKFYVSAEVQYQAWPETAHAARCIRQYARETTVGTAHLIAAAVAMSAFSFEAFVQTLGPEAFGEEWSRRPHPAERLPVDVKLKCIGKHFGAPISFGAQPWREFRMVLQARDQAAHPKPGQTQLREVVEAIDASAATLLVRDIDFLRRNPMHDLDRLEAAVTSIEQGLLEIWVISGRPRYALKSWHQATWSVSAAE